MRAYALLNENIVMDIRNLEDDQVAELFESFKMIIDIQDLIIPPQIGWVMVGNKLNPPPGQVISLKEQVKARIKLYQDSAAELLRDLYATNTLLGLTTAQSDQMFDDYQDVLMRIREGAWPTAVYRLSHKTPMGFVTQDMIDNWSSLIQSRMNS